MDLHSIVYVSSARRGQTAEVAEILRISRRNNKLAGITGLLAYKDGNFLQALEGAKPALDRLVSTIKQDPRHTGMLVLLNRPIPERLFASWSMAFRDLDLSPDDACAYSDLLDGTQLDDKLLAKPDQCYRLLSTFRQNMRF